jgi:DNA-directed RNA polymerase specialized sigma24 family protein
MPDGSDAEYLAYVHGRTGALRRVAHLLCGDAHQADDLVQETITKLYARQQAVLVLRYLCDQPVSEVARLLGCSEGAADYQVTAFSDDGLVVGGHLTGDGAENQPLMWRCRATR